jgi:hypothetical protein
VFLRVSKKIFRKGGGYGMTDQDTIKRARQANLIDYLLSCNEPLARNGHRYRHKDHDSLVFTKNAYYWNSRQEHGNAIDYLTRHLNMTFSEAVEALTDTIPYADQSNVRPSAPTRAELNIKSDCKRAIAYLSKSRHIDYSVINTLLKSKHLYQEADTNNIIFPMYDECGEYVGAELQGTLSEKRFKGVAAGSRYGYGFNVRYSIDNTFDYALFFESAVDLLSFIDLKTNHEKKTLDHCILISMCGLKFSVMKTTLTTFRPRKDQIQAVVCMDNDKAAENFLANITAQNVDYIDRRPDRLHKDYNDQLKALKSK